MTQQTDESNNDGSQAQRLRSYIDSPRLQERLYKRTLLIVVISQIFSGAGLAAGVTVGALLVQDLLGTEQFAGIPAALFTLGSAAAAMLIGRLTQRSGRRIGLSTGTTFGAVAGPNLVDVMGRFASSYGIPALAGPFILAAAAYLSAGIVILALLRPDPYVIAKAIADANTMEESARAELSSNEQSNSDRGIYVGTTVMVLTQIVMAGIMTMTPIHMMHHGHGLDAVGLVIGIHIGAMYLPSLVTGILVDKI